MARHSYQHTYTINTLLLEHCLCAAPQVFLRLGRCQRLLWPPLPIGAPPGEVSLQPLVEVLKPDSLVGLFAAVLLEQRVLLRVRSGTSGWVCKH